MENNNYPENRNPLPRRGFLRLLALGAGAVLLSACQKALETLVPTPSRTPNPTATGTATLNPTSTSTPTPTETATVTPTPTPVVRAEPWERSREDKDKTLAQMMFPFVGGINHINRQGIDLRYENLNIAIVQDSVIDPSGNVQPLRDVYAQRLNQNPQRLEQLASIRAQLEGAKNVTVVIQDGEITQVTDQPFQTITRYVLEDDVSLREMTAEEEPELWSELELGYEEKVSENGDISKIPAYFCDGEKVILRGAVCPNFERKFDPNWIRNSKQDLDNLRDAGGNIVRIGFDMAGLNNPAYMDSYIKAIIYARQNGFRICTGIGASDGMDVYLNSTNDLKQAWVSLLNKPNVAKILSKNVDIFFPLDEPSFKGDNISHRDNGIQVTWGEWKITAEEIVDIIRSKIGRSAIWAVSGVDFATDARGALFNYPDREGVIIQINPWSFGITGVSNKYGGLKGFEDFINTMQKKGHHILIGEFGSTEDSEYIKKILGIFVKYDLPFLFWSWISGNQELVKSNGRTTGNATLVVNYFIGIEY